MKPCSKHWAAMRAAVEERGMTHLVKSGEAGFARTMREAEALQNGEPAPKMTAEEYDPLVSMFWMVLNRALSMGGLYMMTTPPGGSSEGDEDKDHYCPICEAMRNLGGRPYSDRPDLPAPTAEEIEREWIHGPADAALSECRRLGSITNN